MDTQLSKFIDGRVTTSPTIRDLCHSAFVSCDTILSERIAPPAAPDPAVQRRLGEGRAQNLTSQVLGSHHRSVV